MALIQALILRHQLKGAEVLVGRWLKGAFAGRITGLLGQQTAPETPEVAAVRTARDLSGLDLDPARLSRRAHFTFAETEATHSSAQALGEAYDETQLVYFADDHENLEPQDTASFLPHWCALDDLPFDEMPQDDVHWYLRVLRDGQRLTGHFRFAGEELLDHTLEEVPDLSPAFGDNSVDDDRVTLVHNPRCSKSRALRAALEDRGVDFTVREYLREPLTLTDLEALCARGLAPIQLSRDAGVGDDLSALARRPELLQRPVLVRGRRAALGRPTAEDALALVQDRFGELD